MKLLFDLIRHSNTVSIACAIALSLLFPQEEVEARDVEHKYTFVIVHGATGGGWDWKTVAKTLSAQGHDVFRPTLTGLGEKMHLASERVNLSTHISDVSNLILFEDLNDVILVGHSYGGMVITGVANRMPGRVQHLTFLDAAVPDDGMTALDVWGTKFGDLNVVDDLVFFSWLAEQNSSQRGSFPRDVPHPANTLTEPVEFSHVDALNINASYVAFIPQGTSADERKKDDPSWHRAEARGWTVRTFEGDHVIYRVRPKEFVEMLVQTPLDRNKR